MIYCFDLDNTLCTTSGADYMNAIPLRERIGKVNQLYDDGHTIIIETARGCISGKNWYYATVEQLKEWGVKFHTLRTGVKFNADIFIDDRGCKDTDFFNDSFKESGSGKNTKLLLVNRVRKEATNERMDKLIDEVEFINLLPDEFKPYFPKITTYGIKDGISYYEMENYALPSLRRLIFSGNADEHFILYWLEKVVKFSMQMYNHTIMEKPIDYINDKHWKRFNNRMQELSNNDIFSSLLKKQTIKINDVTYDNAYSIIDKIRKLVLEKPHLIEPDFIGRWSHSDLHFSNILIDIKNDSFKLIDPRGYDCCDPHYDFGKIWHSVNGKYEMVANDMFDFYDIDNNNISFKLKNNNYFKLMETLKAKIPSAIFKKYCNYDMNLFMAKVEFNEAMHFITLVPFQLTFSGMEQRALVAYSIGIELLNKWYKKYAEYK